ncbi:DUF1800 domain-containing protein [Aquimarina sediminis]|uniref:DUF1800 domain-containing protein n=1 Tax=Aquimarina sediminis TaxID=2070536 RepID=UPI0013E8E52F|nr:DUF1800 domain-containing protein [Aquimarina sediminis]
MNNHLSDKQIQHLYWRVGFGISAIDLKKVRTLSKNQITDRLFTESKSSSTLSIFDKVLEKRPANLSPQERKQLSQLRRKKMNELNVLWFQQLIDTRQTLREKMTLFFHDHFAVRIKMPRANVHLNNIIRKHALGNFGDMLLEVSKSPAMLTFLNNRQNRKNHPNENFAREIMELFTLGRDNIYTETDIKEAARAFTGWNFDKNGTFIFRIKQHDYGSKTVLGKTGNFKGEDIIKILLEEKQTAKYITQKLYTYLVNPIINQNHVEQLSKIFYDSNYNLKTLIRSIIKSDWFYNDENIGAKIKSPIELLIGLSRSFEIKYNDPKTVLYLQKKLNQMLFFPPNVAGWPGGKTWIDNSTLMLRLKLPSILLNGGVIPLIDQKKTENMMAKEQLYKKIKSKVEKKVKTTSNWNIFLSTLGSIDETELTKFILQPELSSTAKRVMAAIDITDTKSFVIGLLSLPEYQLC